MLNDGMEVLEGSTEAVDSCSVSPMALLRDEVGTRSRRGRVSWNSSRETQSLLSCDAASGPSSEIVNPIISSERFLSIASWGPGSSMIKRALRRASADGRAGMG